MKRPIVFLHLPKTGGQNIHHAVAAQVGAQDTSPLRLQSQAKGGPVFPPRYRFHSGHLWWSELDDLPGDPFAFTVLREPRERLGSFFFFMREEARARQAAEGAPPAPLDAHLLASADRTFFEPGGGFRPQIHRQWANLATTYLAHRRLVRPQDETLASSERLSRAVENSRRLQIYRFGAFEQLETDLEALLGTRPAVTAQRRNAGPLPQGQSRWQALLDEIEDARRRRQMEALVDEDEDLMSRVDFRQPPLHA